MSKSLGIGVEPEEVISKFGADVLRLWVSSVDFVEDVRLSDTILKRLSEAYASFAIRFSKTCSAISTILIRTPTPSPAMSSWKSISGFF